MHLTVPKNDVLVIILKHSDQCSHYIGGIHRPNYLEYVHNDIVPTCIADFKQYFFLK